MLRDLVKGLFTAFSIYSIIPVPKGQADWDRGSVRFALCFFPLVGVVIGLCALVWYELCRHFSVAPALFAAVATLLPGALSGGIHLDGYLDTADALASHSGRDRRLQILQDSHVGAFGVLFGAGYLLLSFGLWFQLCLAPRFVWMAAVGYVVSRSLNGLSILTFPTARSEGMVHYLSNNASMAASVAVCKFFVLGMLAVCVLFSPLWGCVVAVATGVLYLVHRRFCRVAFGGNTGDLAGFLLQNTELLFLALAALGGIVL